MDKVKAVSILLPEKTIEKMKAKAKKSGLKLSAAWNEAALAYTQQEKRVNGGA